MGFRSNMMGCVPGPLVSKVHNPGRSFIVDRRR